MRICVSERGFLLSIWVFPSATPVVEGADQELNWCLCVQVVERVAALLTMHASKPHKQIPSQFQPALNKVCSASAAGVQHCLSAYPMYSILLGLTGIIGTCSLLSQRQLLRCAACMFRQLFS